MRTLSHSEQEERKRKLLQAIIHQYIKTGKPVGSAFLADQYKLDLSPATIRHIMAELEESGYLSHPHTSAGRVPTDKAYRFYVDGLIELQRLAQMEEEKIRREYEARIREIEELMFSTSKTLSVLSNYTGFALAPGLHETRLQHIELIPLDGGRLLAVLVADSGQVRHRVVTFAAPFPRELVSPLSRLLNERLRGKSFSEARDSLLDQIEAFGHQQADLLQFAKSIGEQAFDMGEGRELHVEGAGNILSLPDFQSQEQIRSLVHLLDEKRTLGELLTRDMAADAGRGRWPGVHVKIGSEINSPDLQNLSLISSSYTINGRTVGVLGIIGPKRMEYSKMISLVNYVSKTVSGALNRLLGG